jgi:membrane protease YdiL (CAAX protease family)
VFLLSLVVNKVAYVPVLTPLMHWWSGLHPLFGATAIPNFVLYALIPGLLVLALGAKPRELGLTLPRAGTLRASLAALILPLIFCGWALFGGKLGFGALGFVLVRNFLSSGFSEEFEMRGLALSHLRAFLPAEWAVFAQAMLFALFHVASSLDEPGALLLPAYLIATSAIQGYILGLIALRTRSLFLPVLIHTSLGMMKEALK